MEQLKQVGDVISRMGHSKLSNYIVPGLESYLLGGGGDNGIVRFFHSTRDHHEVITPHSHRYNFTCLVIEGEVWNTSWFPDVDGDQYSLVKITPAGKVGEFNKSAMSVAKYKSKTSRYQRGYSYSMYKNDIHSIMFTKGAKVLFFEEPTSQEYSYILQPFVGGKTVNTFRVEDWMYESN